MTATPDDMGATGDGGFQSSATTKEDFFKDLYRYTVNRWSQNGMVPASVGTTTPLNDEAVTDFDSMSTQLSQHRMAQYRAKGGYAADSIMTPNSESYSQRRYDFLSRLEGTREYAYEDHEGFKTVGVGFNMDANKGLFKQTLGVDDGFYQEVYDGKRKLTPIQIRNLFDASAHEAENVINKRIGNDTVIPETQRLALVSMAFNGPSLIGPKITAAVKAGDDNAALEEILHNSNATRHRGLASRRYQEAQMFTGASNTAALLPSAKDYLKGFA